MAHFFKIPPRIRVSGDKDAARSLIGFAKKQFMIMEWTNVQNLPQTERRLTFPDGTTVHLHKRFGLCEIDINVPPRPAVVAQPEEIVSTNVGIFYVNVGGLYFWIYPSDDQSVTFISLPPIENENRLKARYSSQKSIVFNDQRYCLSPTGYILKTIKEQDIESQSVFDLDSILYEGPSGIRIHSFGENEFTFYETGSQSITQKTVSLSIDDDGKTVVEGDDIQKIATVGTTEDFPSLEYDRSTVQADQVNDTLTFMARDCYGSYLYSPEKSPGRYIDIGFYGPPLNYQAEHSDMGPLYERDLHNAFTGDLNHFNYREDINRFAEIVTELTSKTSAYLVTGTLQRLPSLSSQGDWLTPRFVHVTGTLDDVVFSSQEAQVSGLSVDDQFTTYTHNIWTPTGFSAVEHGEHAYSGEWVAESENVTETPSDPGYSEVTPVMGDNYIGCDVVHDRDLSPDNKIANASQIMLTWKYDSRHYDYTLEGGSVWRKDNFPIGNDEDPGYIPFHIRSRGLFQFADGTMSMDSVGSVVGTSFEVPGDNIDDHDFLLNNSVAINNSYPDTGGIFDPSNRRDYYWWANSWDGRLVGLGDNFSNWGYRDYKDKEDASTPETDAIQIDGWYLSDPYTAFVDSTDYDEDSGNYMIKRISIGKQTFSGGVAASDYLQAIDFSWWKREATAKTPGAPGTTDNVQWIGNLLHFGNGYFLKDTYMRDLNDALDRPRIEYKYGLEKSGSRVWDLFEMLGYDDYAMESVDAVWDNIGNPKMEIDQDDCEKDILATAEVFCGAADETGSGDLGTSSNAHGHLYWLEEEAISDGCFTKPVFYVDGIITSPHYLDNRADTKSYPGRESNSLQTLLVTFKHGDHWRMFIQKEDHEFFQEYGVEVTDWKAALWDVLPDSVKAMVSGDTTFDDLIIEFGMV